MTSLCGWFSTSSVSDATLKLDRMLGSAPASSQHDDYGRAALAAGSNVPPSRTIALDGFALTIVGHPRLVSSSEPSEFGQRLAQRVRDIGEAALTDIGGDFALAAWDVRKQLGLIAVDRIGIQPLFYAEANGALVFSTTIAALARFPGVDTALSSQSVFDYLHFHVCPGPATIYRGIRRLNAGHVLNFGQGARYEPRPYWSMRFEEDQREDMTVLKSRFLEVVRDAVQSASADAPCGTFLSGGTDSSTVTGMLGRVSGRPARAFSIGFHAAGYDEMHYARTAARHFGAEHHEYYVTPDDVMNALPAIAGFYDQPFGNASAIPAYYCAKVAREHGVTRLLAGDGGDELFGGNERYAKQQVLALYQRLPIAIRHGLIEPLTTETRLFSLPGLRKVRSYVEQAAPPMPARYETYNLLNHLGPENVLDPEFLSAVDRHHPQTLMQDAYAPYADRSLINQLLGIDLRFTLADSDLPKVTRMCSLAGVDVVFPLLDDRVVDFSAKLAPDLKLRGTQLRWFFKEALRGFLPGEVITKQKQGFGLPVGTWMIDHQPLHNLARDAIDLLKPYGFVRPSFVNELMRLRLHEHPRYYGTMVWILAALGLWLEKHRQPSGPT